MLTSRFTSYAMLGALAAFQANESRASECDPDAQYLISHDLLADHLKKFVGDKPSSPCVEIAKERITVLDTALKSSFGTVHRVTTTRIQGPTSEVHYPTLDKRD